MQQGQVAAARSAGSSYQLLHGRTADGKLAIAGGAAAISAGNCILGTTEHKGSLRIQGLKLPSSWKGLQEVPRGSYIYGQDGRVQQYEFVTEAGCSAEVGTIAKAYMSPLKQHGDDHRTMKQAGIFTPLADHRADACIEGVSWCRPPSDSRRMISCC